MYWYTLLQNLDEYVPQWLPFVLACLLFISVAWDRIARWRDK